MDGTRVVYGVSLVAHLIGGAALSYVKAKPPQEIVQLEMEMVEREEKKEEEEPEPEPEPEPLPQPKAAPAPAPVAEAAPPPAPDFGFKIGPSTGGPGGVAVPTKAPAPVKTAAKQLGPAPKAEGTASAVADTKAKPLPGVSLKPVYTAEATAAQIEGKVRLEITVDETGAVVDVRVLEGLGYGLDEAAVAAVRGARFTPATQGGRPVRSTFTLGIRFVL